MSNRMDTTQSLKEQMSAELTNGQWNSQPNDYKSEATLAFDAGEFKRTGEKLVHYEEIEGTPFSKLIRDGKIRLTFGRYVVTEELPLDTNIPEYLHVHKWDMIISIIICINNATEQIKKNDLLQGVINESNIAKP